MLIMIYYNNYIIIILKKVIRARKPCIPEVFIEALPSPGAGQRMRKKPRSQRSPSKQKRGRVWKCRLDGYFSI